MEFKGTPAPWHYNGNHRAAVEGSTTDMVASVYPMHYENAEEMKANAHLIAAAPELLSELIRLRNIVASYKQDSGDNLDITDAVIAKAPGQQ
ncbi:hypothetical protein [Moellerella wisconsensis]|uniref:Uncharacterized protein n=1 Tax=Moellerella wisconsensis TaxID=158849 RepID=A0A9Q8Q1Q7_9GAMM|nr:hypothetical protein [Moellerella wisconsensis]UNH30103.1 hypothetical protein MNY72_12225 [Moellerella wisconsensis]